MLASYLEGVPKYPNWLTYGIIRLQILVVGSMHPIGQRLLFSSVK